jgi:hypothetical protein
LVVMGHRGPGELVHRARRGEREAVRDREMLGGSAGSGTQAWSCRRCVSGSLRRTCGCGSSGWRAAGLVRLQRRHVTAPWIVSLTGAGARAIGETARRAPRIELHQAHELAIDWLCARVETAERRAGFDVLTEREMRTAERARRPRDEPPLYGLQLDGAPRGQRSRIWSCSATG